jgi:type II secretory pathway component PulJ
MLLKITQSQKGFSLAGVTIALAIGAMGMTYLMKSLHNNQKMANTVSNKMETEFLDYDIKRALQNGTRCANLFQGQRIDSMTLLTDEQKLARVAFLLAEKGLTQPEITQKLESFGNKIMDRSVAGQVVDEVVDEVAGGLDDLVPKGNKGDGEDAKAEQSPFDYQKSAEFGAGLVSSGQDISSLYVGGTTIDYSGFGDGAGIQLGSRKMMDEDRFGKNRILNFEIIPQATHSLDGDIFDMLVSFDLEAQSNTFSPKKSYTYRIPARINQSGQVVECGYSVENQLEEEAGLASLDNNDQSESRQYICEKYLGGSVDPESGECIEQDLKAKSFTMEKNFTMNFTFKDNAGGEQNLYKQHSLQPYLVCYKKTINRLNYLSWSKGLIPICISHLNSLMTAPTCSNLIGVLPNVPCILSKAEHKAKALAIPTMCTQAAFSIYASLKTTKMYYNFATPPQPVNYINLNGQNGELVSVEEGKQFIKNCVMKVPPGFKRYTAFVKLEYRYEYYRKGFANQVKMADFLSPEEIDEITADDYNYDKDNDPEGMGTQLNAKGIPEDKIKLETVSVGEVFNHEELKDATQLTDEKLNTLPPLIED